jgi:hypothetical protein
MLAQRGCYVTDHTNRIVVGLPARYEKAKVRIAVLEERQLEIANLMNDPLLSDRDFRKHVRDIIGCDQVP